MGHHDDFDLDVRLGNGRSSMEVSQPQDGDAPNTNQTCAGQNTCDGQQTCANTQCQQDTCNTCSDTCSDTCYTCATKCDQDTCGVGHTCETCLTECEAHTCLSCDPPHTCNEAAQCLPQ